MICQGNTWVQIGSSLTQLSPTCSTNLEYSIQYDSSTDDFLFCKSGQWNRIEGLLAVGTDAGGSCATPGAVQFDSDILSTSVWAAPEIPPMKWASIAAGAYHTCAIRDGDFRAFCWGSNGGGRIGAEYPDIAYRWPAQLTRLGLADGLNVPWRDVKWTKLSSGAYHTCGIRNVDGRLFCWGRGNEGQLGTGSSEGSSNPTPLAVATVSGVTSWKDVTTGSSHTCAIANTDKLYCWGSYSNGLLGISGLSSNVLAPALVDSSRTWLAVSAGSEHSCALELAGGIYCWGKNGDGRLGDGTIIARYIPTAVAGTNSGWVQVSVANESSCGLKSTGQIYCWGDNSQTQLGLGSSVGTADQTSPQALSGTWTEVSIRNDHACAIEKNTGIVHCWGNNGNGQGGNGTIGGMSNTPTSTGIKGKKLSLGLSHSCAIDENSEIKCWGLNTLLQLGNWSATNTGTPTALVGGKIRFCKKNGGAPVWYR